MGRDVGEILTAVPSEADRVALDRHLREISRLSERLDANWPRAQELDQTLELDAAEVPTLPDPVARQTLVAALRRAQALGDVVRQRGELVRQVRDLEGKLTQTLSELGTESVQVLRGVQPLLDAQIARTRQELSNVDEELRKAHDEDLRLKNDLDEQRLRQRQLAAEGEVVTAETLRAARARREDGWTRIRRAYVERSDDAVELGRVFDPDRSLPEAFEVAQGEVDRQADLLRADAKRAAGLEECSARIEQMQGRQRDIGTAMTTLAAQRASLLTIWAQQLAQAKLPDLDADALREWQLRRRDALELAERLAALHSDCDRVLVGASTAASEIAAALYTLGQPVVEEGSASKVEALPSLIEQALQWEKHAAKNEAEHGERAKTVRAQRAERERIGAVIAKTEAEVQGHAVALQAWHARLFLPSDSTSEAVRARLDELDGLVRQATALSDARLGQAQHQAVVDEVTAQVAQLATLIGEPVPGAVGAFADRLRKRLTTSRDRDQQRNTLTRDRTRAQARKRQAEDKLVLQRTTLARLCEVAGVTMVDQLPEREDSAARKRHAQTTLSKLRQQLAQASARSEDALRQSLAGQDAVAMESERERCRAEIAQREQEQTAARHAEEQARRALEAIDSSDRAATARESMESAAARYRAAIRPWARLRLAHALLQESVKRFRERAQAPMVVAATTYFSLMTGGRYERLVADEAEDKPVLRAQRVDGVPIGVEAMSEGTADQLYLALRLAALELRRASHPQMPLVLDDVLVTSDDERAGNILRALAKFAEGGQVMIFTHHRHLIDVARAVLGDEALMTYIL